MLPSGSVHLYSSPCLPASDTTTKCSAPAGGTSNCSFGTGAAKEADADAARIVRRMIIPLEDTGTVTTAATLGNRQFDQPTDVIAGGSGSPGSWSNRPRRPTAPGGR